MADQLFDHQVFKHLLAILAPIAQVIILQDEVIAFLRTHAQRHFTSIGGVHVLDAQLTQHGADRTAEIREIIDDQKTFLVVRQHRGCPGK
ncbi:hypothetical protein D3C84_1177750 [compost metagenome]